MTLLNDLLGSEPAEVGAFGVALLVAVRSR